MASTPAALPLTETTSSLVEAVQSGAPAAAVEALLNAGADARFQDEASGRTVLMLAAQQGTVAVVQELLNAGAPWNALDRSGRCAGEYALEAGHQPVIDQLVEFGVRCELLLSALGKQSPGEDGSESRDYLSSSLTFVGALDEPGAKIVDARGEAVMMAWETPLMEVHAKALLAGDDGVARNIVNVGFGLGIFDRFVEELRAEGRVDQHVVVEAHPDVMKRIVAEGFDKLPNVTVIFGRWQDALLDGRLLAAVGGGANYDCIFFDTFAEHYSDMREFHSALPSLMRANGRYSFFNGFCPDNVFFQGVYCRIVELEMAQLGFTSMFMSVEMTAPEAALLKSDATWAGIKRRYFYDRTYFMPMCVRTH